MYWFYTSPLILYLFHFLLYCLWTFFRVEVVCSVDVYIFQWRIVGTYNNTFLRFLNSFLKRGEKFPEMYEKVHKSCNIYCSFQNFNNKTLANNSGLDTSLDLGNKKKIMSIKSVIPKNPLLKNNILYLICTRECFIQFNCDGVRYLYFVFGNVKIE